jgi:predicted nucleic acid-binding protein
VSRPAVVLDTNVFVAAGFNPGSRSARILEAVAAGELHLVWNEATRRETEYVVRKIPPLSWGRWSPLFQKENRYEGETHPEDFDYVPDADDRKFAALATASGATLVTNDDHLLAHRERLPCPVRTPGEFRPGR